MAKSHLRSDPQPSWTGSVHLYPRRARRRAGPPPMLATAAVMNAGDRARRDRAPAARAHPSNPPPLHHCAPPTADAWQLAPIAGCDVHRTWVIAPAPTGAAAKVGVSHRLSRCHAAGPVAPVPAAPPAHEVQRIVDRRPPIASRDLAGPVRPWAHRGPFALPPSPIRAYRPRGRPAPGLPATPAARGGAHHPPHFGAFP